MFISELLFALIIAFIFSLVFGMAFCGYGLGMGFFLFFIVLFLMTWVGGIWVTPFGPLWFGVPWLPFLFVGLLIALIMTVLAPDRRQGRGVPGTPQDIKEIREEAAIDVFFWVLLSALILVLIIGYAVR
jgi:hypothetical protein